MNTFNSFFSVCDFCGTDLMKQKPPLLRSIAFILNCCDLSFVKYRYLINFAESKTRKFVDYIRFISAKAGESCF